MTRSSRRVLATSIAALLATGFAGGLSHQASAATSQAKMSTALPYDFNGDGRQDLVSGSGGGEIIAVDGTANGLASTATQITPTTPGMPTVQPGQSFFGNSLTSADFNRDGYADLAVVDEINSTITVLLGSKNGLTTAGSYLLTPPGDESYFFGTVKAADVNDDGWPDLMAQTTSFSGDSSAVGLTVMYGGPMGLTTAGSYEIPSPDPMLGDFGGEIASGNVNGDKYPDLVVGGRGLRDEDDGNTPGGTWYCPGTATGPKTCTKIGGTTGGVAIGNVTGSSLPDVITSDAGVVTVYPGTAHGLGDGKSTTFSRGADHNHPNWSAPIAVGKVVKGRYDDVVLGDMWWHHISGRIAVMYGAKSGLSSGRRTLISESTKGVPGAVSNSTEGAEFGASLGVLEVNGTGRPDLLIGAPSAPSLENDNGLGAVYFFKGAKHGPSTKAQRVLRNSLKGLSAAGRRFGAVVGAAGTSIHL